MKTALRGDEEASGAIAGQLCAARPQSAVRFACAPGTSGDDECGQLPGPRPRSRMSPTACLRRKPQNLRPVCSTCMLGMAVEDCHRRGFAWLLFASLQDPSARPDSMPAIAARSRRHGRCRSAVVAQHLAAHCCLESQCSIQAALDASKDPLCAASQLTIRNIPHGGPIPYPFARATFNNDLRPAHPDPRTLITSAMNNQFAALSATRHVDSFLSRASQGSNGELLWRDAREQLPARH
jgi:hypothetical protein